MRPLVLIALFMALVAFAIAPSLAWSDDLMVQPLFLEAGETLESAAAERILDVTIQRQADDIFARLEDDTMMEIAAKHAAESDSDSNSSFDQEADQEVTVEGEAEGDAEQEVEVDGEAEGDAEQVIEVDGEAEGDAEQEVEVDEAGLLQIQAAEAPEGNPTYVLPYPPVLPGHYSPLFNPYTNVNPLSTPFANYAAQPGAHPGVAAAAAAQAGALAAVNGQVAGAGGAMPYYPYAARNPAVAGQLAGNPVPFSGYAGWINPQNMNSAGSGTNPESEFPQFIEVTAAEVDPVGCIGCHYD